MMGRDGFHKIAILRANAIGDFVFALPALDSLRERYPRAEIVLLGQEWQREFLAERTGPIDRVIPVPAAEGIGEPLGYPTDAGAMERFFEAMRAERFDLAIQCTGADDSRTRSSSRSAPATPSGCGRPTPPPWSGGSLTSTFSRRS